MPRNKRGRKNKSEPRCTRILISCPDVEIEYKSPNSLYSVEANELTIVELQGGNNGEVKTFLEAGIIRYELVRGVTSYSRPERRVFILSNNREGTRVKLVFSFEPSHSCDNLHTVLQDTLECSEVKVLDRRSQCHASGVMETNEASVSLLDLIVLGSEVLAHGLVSGAESVSKMIDHGTPALIDSLIPEEKPTEVDPAIQVGLKVAKGISQEVAAISEIKTSAVAAVATGAGHFLAPHIKELGKEVLTSDYGYSTDEAERKMDRALEVTAGVATGIATLFNGFMSACSIVGDSISRNAVEVVKHKYGDAAADATNDALGIVTNVASTRMNEKRRQKKGIAVQAASGIYPVDD